MVLNASQASTARGASGETDPDPLLAVLRLVAVMRRRPGHVGPAAGQGGAKPAGTLPCEGPPNITCLQPDLHRGQRPRLQSQQGFVPTLCGTAAAPHLLCQHSGPRGSRRVGGWPAGPVAEGLEPAASSSPGRPAVRSSAVDEWNNDAALPVDISNHVRWSMEGERSAHGGMHGSVDGRVHATCLQSDLAVAARLQPAAAKDTTQLPQTPLPAPQGPPHELIPPASAATPVYLQSSSMFVLGPTNRMRLWTVAITEDRMFSNFILLVICGSALNLALELPKLPLEHPYMRRLNIVDWVFTCIFALEMALKLVAKGVVGHPGAYFRTPWDVFDGVIVVTSLVALSGVQAQATVLRSLRLLRLLRPLRLLRKWRGMQLVVETLIQSIPSVSNVLLFGIFLMGIFAILGVQLFAGRMSRCNQAVVEGVTVAWRDECTPGVFICQEADLCSTGEEVHRSWSRPFRNFDNIGNAMLTLFTLATLDAFMALAQQCIDTVGVDNQPKEKNAPWMGLYVLSFVFLGSWFWVNLLVSVVVQFYSKLVVEKGDVLVSKQAKEYVKLFRLTNKADYWKGVPVPSNRWRARALRIVAHPYFDRVTIAVVVTNVIIMGCDHYNETDEFSLAMTGLNFGFTSCFVVEMVLKLMALGWGPYLSDNWNRLDCFVILVSIPDLVSSLVPALSNLGFMTIFRVFRVARAFKLINKAKGLRTLFNTLISSSPAIANVGSLLFLLMFMYAVLGMNIFGASDRYDGELHANFDNFGTSLLTLFRVFTADGWQDVMRVGFDCNDQSYQCDMASPLSVAAGLFFPSFVITVLFIMLNLVIAVIMDNFVGEAQSEGLLKSNNFVDLLKTVITLKVFVKLLRRKIEVLKEKEHAKRRRHPGDPLSLLLSPPQHLARQLTSPEGGHADGCAPGSDSSWRMSSRLVPQGDRFEGGSSWRLGRSLGSSGGGGVGQPGGSEGRTRQQG
ncbi:Ion transport protein-domain-containing protein [Haematococcus lacustris]